MSETEDPTLIPKPTPDQAAAHEFLCELRTRITTQPLPFQYGVESRALESLWEVFAHARNAMKNHPGCEEFAYQTTRMLNLDLRPVTAKWHRAYGEGRLNSRDGANEFRLDLELATTKLREFAASLHAMAYGNKRKDDVAPAPMEGQLDALLADLPFGIPKQNGLIVDGKVEAINIAEKAAVTARRAAHGIAPAPINAVGLGLSGGGIRSATFGLGVIQVLAGRSLLKDVDFLSTVSGGGYLGCFLTTRLDAADAFSGVAASHGPDTDPIRYLRQRAKYLTASDLKERWSMVTATLAGMILNWTTPLFIVALVALIAAAVRHSSIPWLSIPWRAILVVAGAASGGALLLYAFRMRYLNHTGGRLLGAVIALALLMVVLWLLANVYGALVQFHFPTAWGIAGLVAAAVTAFPAIVRFIPILRAPIVRRVVLKVMLILAGLVIPAGGIAIAFWFYYLGTADTNGYIFLTALTVLFGLVSIFLLNINLTAPHRLYRDQLARTFVYRQSGNLSPIPLHSINPSGFAPYHLINAAANLPSSSSVTLRERRSDFFLFSKHWCGAPAIGYAETSEWRAGGADIDLATAMAVSGAAASSHMGLGSFPTLSALLTFLNVRLGYWIRRPGTKGLFKTPGFLCLIREMFGIAMSEKQAWINLSDGGHIENMAVYELLRRRCKFIISVDGEADPQSTFHGHLTLVRHAQIDFGIRIDPDLTNLRQDTASKFSQSHTMMCRVHYPAVGGLPSATGLILYLKLSVTGNEAELIRRYRALNPDFPHQTTLDQFFDEEQFEAYRQLGVHVAEGLFSPALLGPGARPATVKEWFTGLATNLLLP